MKTNKKHTIMTYSCERINTNKDGFWTRILIIRFTFSLKRRHLVLDEYKTYISGIIENRKHKLKNVFSTRKAIKPLGSANMSSTTFEQVWYS